MNLLLDLLKEEHKKLKQELIDIGTKKEPTFAEEIIATARICALKAVFDYNKRLIKQLEKHKNNDSV